VLSNANVTEANGVISIAGFGTFAIPTVAAAAGRHWHGVCTQSADDTKTYDIVLGIRSVLSNIFSDIDVWTSNLKQVVLTLVGRLLQLKLQDLTIR
jgi:hypothetical protein